MRPGNPSRPGLWEPFRRPVGGPSRYGTGGLRFEANFGLSPFFLGLYKLGVSLVEGAVGDGLVADEECEVVRDGDLAMDAHGERYRTGGGTRVR